MIERYALLPTLAMAFSASAQYCEPTFANGCFSWQTQSVNIGTIGWSVEDCAIADYTSLSTDITPGVPSTLYITNGNWCGCAVWIDLDNNGSFEDEEVQYTLYGNTEVHNYETDIVIPVGTPSGPHRMRVIAGWGSDGVTEGPNGYGPCGSYQYGTHNDFTLNVLSTIGIDEVVMPRATLASANPTDGLVRVNIHTSLDRVRVLGLDGRVVMETAVGGNAAQVELDLTTFPAGIYMLECFSGEISTAMRVVKY